MRSGLSLLFGACVAAFPFPDQANADCSCTEGIAPGNIITKDVLIVGGGATGTYSAIRLRDDFKKSVIVIEKESRLGGHTETYTDPATGRPVEIGVQVWLNETVTNAYLARLGVPTVGVPLTSTFATEYADFKTGKLNTQYSPSQVTEAVALLEYAMLIQNYPYLAAGSYNLPDTVPEDLLSPFGQFVAKYQIQAALPIIFTFANGLGNLLEEPTIYVIQNIGLQVLQGLQGGGFLTAASPNGNSELYNKAQVHLGADVLLNSVVKRTCRQDQGLNQILVQTPEGLKLIQAKKLLVTIPPTLDNLKDFDVDSTEKDVFAQLHSSSLYSFLLSKTGIPDNTSVVNAPPNSATYNLPTAPYVASFDYTGTPGIHRSYAIGPDSLTKSDANQLVKEALSELGSAGTFHTNNNFQVAAFAAHTSLQARVTADAIRKGFYKSLYALQGHKGTFWTGSAWAADYSSILWQFTETVLPFVNATIA